MADWAFYMLIATVSLGSLTLGAAIAAALYARKSADAAWKTVDVTREIGQAQVRAYVAVGDISVSGFLPGNIPVLHMTAKNVGQSPALKYQNLTTWRAFSDPHFDKADFRGSKFTNRPRMDLPGEGTSTQNTKMNMLTNELYEGFLAREAFIVFFGKIRYTDVFGKQRRGIFRYYLNVDNLKEGRAYLAPCRKHNRST